MYLNYYLSIIRVSVNECKTFINCFLYKITLGAVKCTH
jgi:hypothetical protein